MEPSLLLWTQRFALQLSSKLASLKADQFFYFR
jgi:hypothetical protein